MAKGNFFYLKVAITSLLLGVLGHLKNRVSHLTQIHVCAKFT